MATFGKNTVGGNQSLVWSIDVTRGVRFNVGGAGTITSAGWVGEAVSIDTAGQADLWFTLLIDSSGASGSGDAFAFYTDTTGSEGKQSDNSASYPTFPSTLPGLDTGSTEAISLYGTIDLPTAPSVDTDAATDVSDTEATLNGEITDVGSGDADLRGFVFGTTSQSDPGSVAPASAGYDDYTSESGTFSADTFSALASGLTAATTYYARAWAHNDDGYAYGDEISFDTSAAPPFRFENLPGVEFDPDDTQTIYAERLNDILERLEALEG